ncbi:hypothetical protein VAE151_550607 [Vibrio aestuarianus]|uniref:Uncharacterized protein n=1 Tax=Vibrio aestuarianus TaxID=28171 RepID=A0ABN8TW43_9VIBR|nr:hypothetical protein VAE308_1050612 [Vibrio aestuarianus]CAH8198504.1 hypothetical protein VIBAE_A31205 [Vibrio aestuarianus subsp. francensis]CAH8199035.1 hypothetical protein VAE032_270608 [Vibrio aestuarianus]CAH8199191.1 hypothetical protein VAE128_460611 [Vibrio aestuarianus]CAH8199650.1 hypothetical protein VAE115_320608 [Vibrio aestuarianus]
MAIWETNSLSLIIDLRSKNMKLNPAVQRRAQHNNRDYLSLKLRNER